MKNKKLKISLIALLVSFVLSVSLFLVACQPKKPQNKKPVNPPVNTENTKPANTELDKLINDAIVKEHEDLVKVNEENEKAIENYYKNLLDKKEESKPPVSTETDKEKEEVQPPTTSPNTENKKEDLDNQVDQPADKDQVEKEGINASQLYYQKLWENKFNELYKNALTLNFTEEENKSVLESIKEHFQDVINQKVTFDEAYKSVIKLIAYLDKSKDEANEEVNPKQPPQPETTEQINPEKDQTEGKDQGAGKETPDPGAGTAPAPGNGDPAAPNPEKETGAGNADTVTPPPAEEGKDQGEVNKEEEKFDVEDVDLSFYSPTIYKDHKYIGLGVTTNDYNFFKKYSVFVSKIQNKTTKEIKEVEFKYTVVKKLHLLASDPNSFNVNFDEGFEIIELKTKKKKKKKKKK